MSGIDVAVAIVSFKCANLTIDCLRSIEVERSIAEVGIRVVVIDNSSDDAPLIARAIEANGWASWVTLAVAPQNGGFAYGNNVALQYIFKESLPTYVHLLNPDTQVRKGAIDALVRFLEANPDVGIAGSSFENLDGSDWPIAFRFPSILSELEQGLQLGYATRVLRPWVVARHMDPVSQPIDWVPGASMMIRRTVIDTIGGFDENYFLYFEETDYCFRAKKAGFSTWYVPESRVMHIAGQSTKVTERKTATKRLPAYWFQSRRRFFATTYGLHYALVADVVALLAHSLGSLKRAGQRRREQSVPYFITDLAKHSTLWRKNRNMAPTKHLIAPRSRETECLNS